MTQDLQKIKSDTLQTVPIFKPADLIGTIPIAVHLRKANTKVLILNEIRISLEKCAMGLGIKMSDYQFEILSTDILEVYQYDSLEDVQQCLKKARQGEYSFEHFKRDVISMPLFRHWMSCHLDDKAAIREKILKEEKALQDKQAETLLESEEMTQDDRDRAQKYLNQMKEIVKNAQLKKQKSTLPSVQANRDFFIREIEKDRGRRLVLKLIMRKVERGEQLSEREKAWCEGFDIKLESK